MKRIERNHVVETALAEDTRLTPSAGFSHRVMAEIRRNETEPRPLPFPWRRLAVALVIALGVGGAVVLLAVGGWLGPGSAPGEAVAVGLQQGMVLTAVALISYLAAALPRWLAS